ncbi:hypothetical protein BH18ACT7_BH18ACT7_09860 [soil metagenome]
MRSQPTVDQALVADLARVMLDRAAAVEPAQVSAERRVFDTLQTAYFADPERALAGDDRGSGQLKFGLPGIEELLTPVLLAASADVLAYLVRRGLIRGAAASKKGVRQLLGLSPAETPAAADVPAGTTEATPDTASSPGLTHDQWAEVRHIVTQALVRHARMPQQRAELIAAAVVADGLTGNQPQ